MKKTRTDYAIKNMSAAIVGQSVGILINVITRAFFIRILSVEYMGLNGLFSNVLSVLSLAELGIGTSIIFSMYKPIAENDEPKIRALMVLYKKTYFLIGTIIFFAGILLTPFLHFFVKDMPDIPQIHLIYVIYVLNSSMVYFFSYKRSLLDAEQKKYINIGYKYVFLAITSILQILLLYWTRNYVFYLLVQSVFLIGENVAVSKYVDRHFKSIKNASVMELAVEDKNQIRKNVKAIFLHHIGETVIFGTDNILLSKMIGLVANGIYSNYYLIFNAVATFLNMGLSALTASIGNLGASKGAKDTKAVFDKLNFMMSWIGGWMTICLYVLLNPFIRMWLGEAYVFSDGIVLALCINFYITAMRGAVQTLKESLGLFWYDRYKPLLESAINLVASIVFALNWGVIGIFLGTIFSTMTTCFWIEPYVLYKYGFEKSVKEYFEKYIGHALVCFAAWEITALCAHRLPNAGLGVFVAKIGICIVVPNLIYWSLLFWTKDFKSVWKMLTRRK